MSRIFSSVGDKARRVFESEGTIVCADRWRQEALQWHVGTEQCGPHGRLQALTPTQREGKG